MNGAPGLRITVAGELDAVLTARVDEAGVVALYVVRNPDKLAHLAQPVALSR